MGGLGGLRDEKVFSSTSTHFNKFAGWRKLNLSIKFYHPGKLHGTDAKEKVILDEKELLVYVSLGSTFNNNFIVYKEILDGIKSFNLGSNSRNIKLDNLKVVVSTGEYVLNKFKNTNNFEISVKLQTNHRHAQ